MAASDAPHARTTADPRRAREARGSEILLAFGAGQGAYAFSAAETCGYAEEAECRLVPGAPACVVGLAEWRGSIVTVIDVVALLEERRGGARGALVRAAPPLHHLAFQVPGTARIVLGGEDCGAPLDGTRLLRPRDLLRAAEEAAESAGLPRRRSEGTGGL